MNLRDSGLYSEDLFILSQILKCNNSLREINLSKNYIGSTHMTEEQVLKLKMKHQESV